MVFSYFSYFNPMVPIISGEAHTSCCIYLVPMLSFHGKKESLTLWNKDGILVGSKELHFKHPCPRCHSNIVSNSCTDECAGKDATLLSQAAMALIIGLSQQTKLDRWDPVSGRINSAIACSRCAGAFCLSHFRPWQWPQTYFLSALTESLAVCLWSYPSTSI